MEEAREALDAGRFTDAVKICKQVLKQDRRNYDGFVLLGVALMRSAQHLDQAELSLKKAISLDPSALLAYQAMIELREATGGSLDSVAESIEAAVGAAEVSGDHVLVAELTRKLAATLSAGHRHDRAETAWSRVLATTTLTTEQRIEALAGLIDAHVESNEGKLGEVSQTMESHLKELVSFLPFDERYREFLSLVLVSNVHRGSKGEESTAAKLELLKHSQETLSTCPSPMAADVLLTMAEDDDSQQLFEDTSFPVWTGKHVAHLYPGRGITLASSKCKVSRKKLAEWDLVSDEHSIAGCRMLAKELLSEGLFERSFETASKGLAGVALKKHLYGLDLHAATLELRLILGEILLLRNNYDEAARVFLNASEEANALSEPRRRIIIGEAFQGLVRLSLATKEREMAKSRLDQILGHDPENHWALSERGWLAFQTNCLNQAKADLENAVSACQDSAIYHYRLGRVYWETDDMKGKAVNEFVESAKIDPSRAETFIYLGHYYKDFAKDLGRAVRCYQKAVSLDAANESLGEMLCNILDHGGQISLEKKICEEASKKSPRAFWAWRRLGFVQAAEKKWSEAIASTQYGLRGYPTDARLWEALALSYKKLGMLTAASKAFRRAFDLDNKSLFAALEMGAIHLALSAFYKATHAYREALRISPGNLAALHGLGSALLGQGREYFNQGAFSWCSSVLKEAIDLAVHSRLLNGNLVAVWKNLGDASLMYAQSLPFELEQKRSWQEAVDFWQTERLNAASKAVHAYRRAIHLLPSEGSLYRDLATAMHYTSILRMAFAPAQSERSEAEIVVLCGLRNDGANADMWVSLALVARHKGLKQHALIRALRLDANHAVAWAYLGQLYLSLDFEDLAQQAFDRARSADPTLSLPWAGMSFVQSQRMDQTLEAFASCSCAMQLSSASNVHLGVGQLAAKTQNLSLPQVYVAVQHATHRQPLEPAAHNLHGLSCESRKEYFSAILAYKNSRSAVISSSDSVKLHNIITGNLARALCKAGNSKDAILEYNKLLNSEALNDFDDFRGYAVALKDSGKGHQAVQLIKKALSMRSLHDNSSQVAAMLVLLARLTYFSQGPLPALNILLSAPEGLFSHEELCLTTLCLATIANQPDSMSAAIYKCRLIFTSSFAAEAYVLLASLNQNGVARNLKNAIHMHPQSGSLRAKTGEIILTQGHGLTSKHLEKLCATYSINSHDMLTQKLSSAVLTDASVAGAHNATEVLAQIRSLVHKEPSNTHARYYLALVLFRVARRQGFPRHICQSILRISITTLHHLSSSSPRHSAYMQMQLELCASECELRLGNYTNALDHAKASLNAAKTFLDFNTAPPYFQLARCYLLLNGHTSATEGQVSDWQRRADINRDTVLWHLSFLELQLSSQMINLDDNILLRLRQSLQQKESVAEQRWLALFEALLARVYYQKGDLELSEDGAANALQLWPKNPVLCLFHGAICLELAKTGKTGHYASKAVASLAKAVREKSVELPVACALLAQAESSNSKDGLNRASVLRKWARHLRAEYLGWPTTVHPIPAELYFLMALLAKQQVTHEEGERCPESERTWWSWLQAALHINPACTKYWTLARRQV